MSLRNRAHQCINWWAFFLYGVYGKFISSTWVVMDGIPPFADQYVLRIDLLCQEERGRPLTSVYPWDEEDLYLLKSVDNNKFLVAYDGQIPIGFLAYSVEHRYYHIDKIAVHPQYRRRGVGSELVWQLYLRMDVIHHAMEVWVREYNDGAIRFFEHGVGAKMGLDLDCQLMPDSYTDTHEDGIVFRIERGRSVFDYYPRSRATRR